MSVGLRVMIRPCAPCWRGQITLRQQQRHGAAGKLFQVCSFGVIFKAGPQRLQDHQVSVWASILSAHMPLRVRSWALGKRAGRFMCQAMRGLQRWPMWVPRSMSGRAM
jgi:hypothetical protein